MREIMALGRLVAFYVSSRNRMMRMLPASCFGLSAWRDYVICSAGPIPGASRGGCPVLGPDARGSAGPGCSRGRRGARSGRPAGRACRRAVASAMPAAEGYRLARQSQRRPVSPALDGEDPQA